jgi:putative hemolysin
MMSLELAIVVALIVVNGLLSMSELAIVSSRPARLSLLQQKNVRGARQAIALAADPGRFLSTVQIGITLVGVLSGAFSGATLGLRLTTWLADLGVPATLADIGGVALVVGAITYATLIIGELVPKQVALRNPEAVAVRVAPAMALLSKVSLPLVVLLDWSGKAVLRLLGQNTPQADTVSEEEIHSLIMEAETAGVLEPGEKEMIAGVMRLGDQPVGAVMTPRPEVDLIDLGAPWEQQRERLLASPHSRWPVIDGREDPVGVIQAKDVLGAYLGDTTPDLRALVRPAPVIPEAVDARDALITLRQATLHMALVYDEYGAFQGIVTSADILESIAGSFAGDDGAAPEPAVVQRDDGSYLIAGWMAAEAFADLLAVPLPEKRDFHTVAGLVLQLNGALPSVGDHFAYHGWKLEVIDLDGRRIDKILAVKLEREIET